MIEELKDEELVKKIGGRFKLSSLIQKRLVYLNKGAQAFVDTDKVASKDKLHIVIKEILQDKIYLDMEGNLHERQPSAVEIVFDSEYTET
ncbi:MAG: DNA-directed RNA polymerase subunit omega [Planctomycetaceae bacterium]|jgi:DNA-directed RNA polymerase subunit omega|nr:DNA-directed RNA polymerase subunit omega [Planctomycetaceae bacterium]